MICVRPTRVHCSRWQAANMWYESVPAFAIITGAIAGAGLALKGIHYFFYDEVRVCVCVCVCVW
jgi:hypothetical protein